MKTLLLVMALAAAAAAAEPAELKPFAHVQPPKIDEGSALLPSRRRPGVFWTVNDSGGQPELYPITRDGAAVSPSTSAYGVRISSASNRDWEALAMDASGYIVIADIGNNANRRRDLALYFVPEPDPYADLSAAAVKKVQLRYPDQDAFPPEKKNFDAEAAFWAGRALYIISKNRADTLAKLYRLDSFDPGAVNVPRLVSRFDAGSMVTDAAATPDGRLLAVLAYEGIWLFGKPARSDDYFAGPARFLPIAAGQCEGIAFDGPDELLVSNEERDLFEVALSSLKPLKK